jgi:adenylosuccinate synthase
VGRLATRLNGLDSIAVTKLDVLDDFASLRICVGYRIDGRVLDEFPATLTELAQAEPIYEEMPGWQASTRHCRHYDELPIQAQRYLERLAALVGAPLAMVAVGPERDQTIILERLLDGPRRQLQAV